MIAIDVVNRRIVRALLPLSGRYYTFPIGTTYLYKTLQVEDKMNVSFASAFDGARGLAYTGGVSRRSSNFT